MEESGVERWLCAVCGGQLQVVAEEGSVLALGAALDLRCRPGAAPVAGPPPGHGWCDSCSYWRPLERTAAVAGLWRR